MAAIPLLKRIGFLGSDGSPTELYDRFRNTETQGAAMAAAMRIGFKDLFDVNEYASDLSKEKLTSLVIQLTGLEKDNRAVAAIVSTFATLKTLADFDAKSSPSKETLTMAEQAASQQTMPSDLNTLKPPENVDLRLSYTINLNLPETTNPEVFNAIFKSLKENLLKG